MTSITNKISKANHNDPVRHCEYYKHKGCVHVDGYLCLMNECDILLEYRNELERWKKLKKINEKIK